MVLVISACWHNWDTDILSNFFSFNSSRRASFITFRVYRVLLFVFRFFNESNKILLCYKIPYSFRNCVKKCLNYNDFVVYTAGQIY